MQPILRFFHRALLPLGVAAIVLFGFFLQKDIFLQNYDFDYIKNRYDYSQWMIPKSERPIDDATLYQVAGYELTANGKYYTMNPEVPPFGKYFYGWSIQLFGNPYLITIPLFLLSIGLFYTIARMVLRDSRAVTIATLLYTAEPLLIHQISDTLLDLPQLIGLLLHMAGIILFIKHFENPVWRYVGILLAGLGLGWFISVKIAFFAVALAGSALFLLWREKKVLWIIPIGAIAGAFYLAVYVPYFFQEKGLIDFLRDQKWMLTFYLSSSAKPIYGMALLSLFLGLEKGWWQDAVWQQVDQWHLFWPFFAIAPFVLWKSKYFTQQRDTKWFWYLISYATLITLCFFIVPFFARYLLLLLPVLIIFAAQIIARLRFRWIVAIVALMLLHTYLFLTPKVWKMPERVEGMIEAGTYQDLYSFVDSDTQREVSRNDFWERYNNLDKSLLLEEKDVTVSLNYAWPWQQRVEGFMTITYVTELGSFDHRTPISFRLEGGIWKLLWNDSVLLDNYVPGSTITTELDEQVRGRLFTAQGAVLSEMGQRPFFLVQPNLVTDEAALRQQLEDLTGIETYDLELLYKTNHAPDEPHDIAFLKPDLPATVLDTTVLQPGISVESRSARTYTLTGRTSEQVYDTQQKIIDLQSVIEGYPGGQIVLRRPDGSRQILVEREKKDGADYTLPN